MKSKFRIYHTNGYWFVEEWGGWFDGWCRPNNLFGSGYKTMFNTKEEAEAAIDTHRSKLKYWDDLDRKRKQEKENSKYEY